MEKILDIIFPKKCIDCGNLSKDWVCDTCFKKLFYGNIEKCENREIKYLISLFSYDEIREKILRFKFNDEPYIYNYFVELAIRNENIKNVIKKSDLIIPVPMYITKKLRRGYNQSELLAKGISNKLDILERNDILSKYKNTKTQSLLNLEERKINLKDCFKLKNKNLLENKNILLVDDIYTTGSTINECVKAFEGIKIKSISVFVIAKNT